MVQMDSSIDGMTEDGVGQRKDLELVTTQSSSDAPKQEPNWFFRFIKNSTMVYYEVKEDMVNIPPFLAKLSTAPEVPLSSKAEVAAALAYVAMPIDAIPDFIPYVGLLDDFSVLLIATAHALNRIPKDIALQYWGGARTSFDRLHNISRRAYDTVERIKPHFAIDADVRIGERLFHAAVYYGGKILRFG